MAESARRAVKVTLTVKMNAYRIITDRLDEAIECGVRRAHKHTDTPAQDEIIDHVEREVLMALDELLDFGAE